MIGSFDTVFLQLSDGGQAVHRISGKVADGLGDNQIYFLRGFDTTLFRAESVNNRRNQGLFVMKALFLMLGI